MLDSDFEDEREPRRVRPTRRDHRSRRIDVMRELESGVVDERPVKERFSREFKNPRIKKIKDPLEKIDEKDCVEGLVVEVHRRTCEARLEKEIPDQVGEDKTTETVTAMYRATTSKALGEFPAVGQGRSHAANLWRSARLCLQRSHHALPVFFRRRKP